MNNILDSIKIKSTTEIMKDIFKQNTKTKNIKDIPELKRNLKDLEILINNYPEKIEYINLFNSIRNNLEILETKQTRFLLMQSLRAAKIEFARYKNKEQFRKISHSEKNEMIRLLKKIEYLKNELYR